MWLDNFKKLPLMGILRGVKDMSLPPLVDVIAGSGLETIEITMNTPRADELIAKAAALARGRFAVGAGTVLTRSDLDIALSAGASFIVSPVCDRNIIDICRKKQVPVFPGAFTPQEVYNAARAGAAMVKVFPAKFFGPDYFRELRGPFNDILLLACGGVNASNIREFFDKGAAGIAFGASIFKPEWISERRFDLIETNIRNLIAGYRKGQQ